MEKEKIEMWFTVSGYGPLPVEMLLGQGFIPTKGDKVLLSCVNIERTEYGWIVTEK